MQLLFESLRVENRPHPCRELDGQERNGPIWPNQSRLGSNLAVLGFKLGRTGASLGQRGRNLRRTQATWPTWAQLGSNMAQLGATWALGLTCATWSCVGALQEPHQSQKTLEIAVKTQVFSGDQSDPERIPTVTHVVVQVRSNTPQLGTLWRQLRPNRDTT
jgi:hypothetical protein